MEGVLETGTRNTFVMDSKTLFMSFLGNEIQCALSHISCSITPSSLEISLEENENSIKLITSIISNQFTYQHRESKIQTLRSKNYFRLILIGAISFSYETFVTLFRDNIGHA